MNDPHFWWYVTRASGLLAWGLMTASVLWGILLSTRVLRGADSPAWLQDLHRYMGGVAVGLTILHMFALVLDPWLAMPIEQLLVPFIAEYRPVPVALGVIAFYLLLVVQLTSLAMHRLPRRFWRALHVTSYAAVLAVAVHGWLAGTDASTWWYGMVATILITSTVLAVTVRIVTARRRQPRSTGVSALSPASRALRDPADPAERRRLTVISKRTIALDVVEVTFARADGGELPPWYPGAHITVRLPGELERQYSLCGDPADRTVWSIAVLRQVPAGPGSSFMHDLLTVGSEVDIVGPRNDFACEPAHEYLFIAGGIGITPLRAMIAALPPQRQWRLWYLGASKSTMAFAEELTERHPGRVDIIARDELDARVDIGARLRENTSQIYVCAGEELTAEVERWVPRDRLHVERFRAVDRSHGLVAAAFSVTAGRSGRVVEVAADRTIVQSLGDQGIDIPTSCGTGVCGTCETRVLSGKPLHLDSVMADDEKDEIGVLYPCVSRTTDRQLVLDI